MSCCSHLPENSNVTPKTPNGCEECLKLGDRWIHLRLCATCGHVGCCDDSKNKHAVNTFIQPIIPSSNPSNLVKIGVGATLTSSFSNPFQTH